MKTEVDKINEQIANCTPFNPVKITYYGWKKLTDELFYGVPLTREHMNYAVEVLRNYVKSSGRTDIFERIGVGIQAETVDGKLLRRDMVFLGGPLHGEALMVKEMELLGLFLPYGAWYDKGEQSWIYCYNPARNWKGEEA